MYTGKLIFSQVMEHLPLHVFHQCVDRYQGDFKIKEFSCLDQYQIAHRACRLDQGLLVVRGVRMRRSPPSK